MKRTRTYAALGALALTAAAALSACGGDSIDDTSIDAAGGEDCGTMNMAVNNWVGYEADAYVVGQVAAEQLGCDVEYKRLDEQVSWKGFGTGEVDVVIENWGHPELQSKRCRPRPRTSGPPNSSRLFEHAASAPLPACRHEPSDRSRGGHAPGDGADWMPGRGRPVRVHADARRHRQPERHDAGVKL